MSRDLLIKEEISAHLRYDIHVRDHSGSFSISDADGDVWSGSVLCVVRGGAKTISPLYWEISDGLKDGPVLVAFVRPYQQVCRIFVF
jgi:hypothetical protein